MKADTVKKRSNWTTWLVVALIFSYILILSYLSMTRLLSFNAYYYDLGIMDQVVYNTSKGRILKMTHPDLARNTSRLAIHFDPIMAIISPFYLIKPSPIILLVAQTVIIAAGGWAVFLIAQKIIKSKWASLLFVFLYLNYYPLQLANLFDFHAVVFATTGLLFAFYFLALHPLKPKKLNTIFGLTSALVVLLSKENTALIVALLCGYLLLTQKKNKRLYLLLGVASIATFLIVVFKVIPYFNSSSSFALSYYDFVHPLALLSKLFSVDSINYLQKILLPFGFISLLSPLTLLIALPDVLLNLLSSNPNMREIYFHYTALITPFVVIGAIYGFNKIRTFFRSAKITGGSLIAGCLLMGTSIFSSVSYGIPSFPAYRVDKDTLRVVRYWQNQLKDDNIRVAATGSVAPFFTERRHFYDFLFDPTYKNMGKTDENILSGIGKYNKADYVIILAKDIATDNPLVGEYYNDLKNNARFILIANADGVEVYKKFDFYEKI